MNRMQRAAVLVTVLESLRKEHSWCGETSVQKTCYLLQELLDVPLGFAFVLYKYGPYSFGLTDELTALRADGVLSLRVVDERYGPRYDPGDNAAVVRSKFPKTIRRYRPQIDFLAAKVGNKDVADLERFATAFYIRRQFGGSLPVKKRAQKLAELKPHIPLDKAIAATTEIDEFCEAAKDQFESSVQQTPTAGA